MKNPYKRLAVLTLTGILLGTTPTASVSAASKKTETVAEDTENIIETSNIEEVEKDTEINNVEEPKKDTEINSVKETEKDTEINNAKETEKTTETDTIKKEKEEVINYTPKILTITKSSYIADTFNGVEALYRKGGNDGSNSTYSCAAYIKRYYKEVHGVTVMNLFSGATPSSSKGNFKLVKTPQEGDIVACSTSSGSNHWAIVKKVNDDNTVTLIEQNWKWSQGGQTVCKVNRSISISSGKFYHLYK